MKAMKDCTKAGETASSPGHSVPHYRRINLPPCRETPASSEEPLQEAASQNHALKWGCSESTTQPTAPTEEQKLCIYHAASA